MINRPRLNLMLERLYDQQARGYITDEWAVKFILDMSEKIKLDYYPFSSKQLEMIDKLFERY